MKLWHDDIRPAPEGWIWARTNEEAIEHLKSGAYDVISMDHDLGLDHIDPFEDDEVIFFAGRSPRGCGCVLANWIADKAFTGPLCVPGTIRIHSWNPVGASEMAEILNDAGLDVIVEPFKTSWYDEDLQQSV